MAIWGAASTITLDDMITRARRMARVTDTSHSDAVIMDLINEGVREFAKDVHGLWAEDYLSILPKFDSRTNYAVKIQWQSAVASASATIALTGTDRTDATGGTVAADFETLVQASWGSATVGWSTTAWKFSINIPAATTITVTTPDTTNLTYVDGTDLIGGGGTTAASIWVSTVPEGCTAETELPSDFVSIEHVEWDEIKLTQASFDMFMSPASLGRPRNYQVKGNRIRLYPAPSRQEKFHVVYKASPTEYTDAATQGSTVCPMPKNYALAPVYYAAATIGEENFEDAVAGRSQGRYASHVRNYIMEYANQVTAKAEPQRFQPMETYYRYEGS
jgi:hypothetical protein